MTALTLYELEENLTCMADTTDLVPAEQEREFAAAFQAMLLAAADKRDRVCHFLAHLEQQCHFADIEIGRLRERKACLARIHERVEEYVIHVIEGLGIDARGRYPKLEGNCSTLSIRKCPPSVSVLDEAAVPCEYKTTSVTLPTTLWAEILDCLDLETRARAADAKKSETVDKKAIKAQIDRGLTVAGADLLVGKNSLQRK